jgi:glycine cleavage system transcriptional repressor
VAHLAVTAFGVDRPGIVAAVTGVLVERGGNLGDSAMTILGGHFAVLLLVEVPGDEEPEALEQALAEATEPLGLSVVVRPVDAAGPAPAPGRGSRWAVTVHGADRPGIVHRVTRLLADHGVNVVDLGTRVVGPAGDPAYVLLLEVAVPAAVDPDVLAADLGALAVDLGVDLHLRPDDADVL